MVRQKFLALESDMANALFEREAEIHGSVLALAAPGGRHLYMLGEPGVGKSLLVTEMLRRIDGAQKFDTLMMRTSLPEQIFGPVSLAGLQADVVRRTGTGKLQEAHLAFLDEGFKANSAILNSMLRILNERVYEDGGGPRKVPLISCSVASNELPQGEDLNALYDRLHLRYVVHRIQDDANFTKMLTFSSPAPAASVSLAEIGAAQAEVRAVKVGATATDGIKKIRLGCEKQGVRVSDRKWRESVGILQAEAWLNDHAEVQSDDLAILQHVLWSAPEERKKVIDVVFTIACPAMPRALEIVDLVAEQRKVGKASPDKLTDAFKVVRHLSDELDALVKQSGAKFTALADAQKKVKKHRAELGALVVGS